MLWVRTSVLKLTILMLSVSCRPGLSVFWWEPLWPFPQEGSIKETHHVKLLFLQKGLGPRAGEPQVGGFPLSDPTCYAKWISYSQWFRQCQPAHFAVMSFFGTWVLAPSAYADAVWKKQQHTVQLCSNLLFLDPSKFSPLLRACCVLLLH